MGDSSTEMVAPRANEENFRFAFNDYDFSDRVLRLEILADESIYSSKKTYRTRKRKKKDSESYDGTKVVTLNINSAILAAKSPFFYKLFKNGMRESQHRSDVSLRINASEEATLMDLLNFIYGNTLSATSAPDLINVLVVADKFEVTSCMRYSIQMLLKYPMSLENALLYLELPSSVLASEIVQPLIAEAKKYVVARYKNFNKSQKEAMELPLSAIEVVLGSDGVQVDSEDDVFDFILKWACTYYHDLEERQEIFTKRLARLICFPNMSSSKLKEVLVCPDFDQGQLSKLVMEALFSKVELSCGQHIHGPKVLTTTSCNFSRRVYKPSCVVYFDLKKGECADLFPSKQLDSPQFCIRGKRLYLSVHCCKKEQQHHLGLFMNRVKDAGICTLGFEFAVLIKSSKKFRIRYKVNSHTLERDDWGMRNLLGIPWTEFMCDDSDYFINDILRLRAKITVLNKSKP